MRETVILLFALSAIALIFCSGFSSAAISIGNPSHFISKAYSSPDSINGWINISMQNEPENSFFTGIFTSGSSKQISLINLLASNPGFQYTCIPSGCGNGFSVTGSGMGSATITLNQGETKSIGINITGSNFNSVNENSFSLNIASNAPESDSPQLSIDILNDSDIEWIANNGSGNFGAQNFGCYSEPSSQDAIMGNSNIYCENITLSAASGVIIGAYVNAISNPGQQANFSLSIEDDSGMTGSCDASSVSGISSQNINCSVSGFSILGGNYSVCIIPTDAGSVGKYKISYENNAPVCGYSGTTSHDFKIYASAEKYSPTGNFLLNDNSRIQGSSTIEDQINQYINSNYNNDCSAGCVVPIAFASGMTSGSQQITISGLNLEYTSEGIGKSANLLYNLTMNAVPSISFNYGQLLLNGANFSTPDTYGNFMFTLNYNGNATIFSENISTSRMPKINSINPTITIAGLPQNFTVYTNNFEANDSKYQWNFGDGDSETTTGKSVVHTYDAIGIFTMNVSILTAKNQPIYTANFNIIAESPKNAIGIELTQKINALNSTKTALQALPQFYRDSLNSVLNISGMDESIQNIINENATASSDDEYIAIMQELNELRIPSQISVADITTAAPFILGNNIDIDALKEITGESISGDESAYVSAIKAWNIENMNEKVDIVEVSGFYGSSSEPILDVVTISASKTNNPGYDPYLIIEKTDNLNFASQMRESDDKNYYYLEITGDSLNLEFSTTEQIDAANIPAFISPALSNLPSSGNEEILPEQKPSNTPVIIALSIVLLAGIAAFILMKIWYIKRYENYLFKNRNDLYNIVSYIQNSKKSGISDKEISSRLKKAGWKAEQVTYIMKKYSKRIPRRMQKSVK